jgi:hypothetical protein
LRSQAEKKLISLFLSVLASSAENFLHSLWATIQPIKQTGKKIETNYYSPKTPPSKIPVSKYPLVIRAIPTFPWSKTYDDW